MCFLLLLVSLTLLWADEIYLQVSTWAWTQIIMGCLVGKSWQGKVHLFVMFQVQWCRKLNACLGRYGTGTLTKVFVDRVFQECLTYDGEVVCMPQMLYAPCMLLWHSGIEVKFVLSYFSGLQDIPGLCSCYGESKRTSGMFCLQVFACKYWISMVTEI